MVDRTVRLRDGRTLAFAEYGNPDGLPLLFFHGTPGSRLWSIPAWDDATMPLRIIAPDRPGMGLSDFQPGRRLLDWPDDVAQLADHLGLERFAVAGVSGGGPHAMACAYKLPGRVIVAASLSGAGPFDGAESLNGMHGGNRGLFKIAMVAPWLLPVLMWPSVLMMQRMPDRLGDNMLKALPEADRIVLRDPEIKRRAADGGREAVRRGARGVVQEAKIFVQPWGFDPGDIKVPVQVWQATEDRNVPAAMGERLGREIPNATMKILPDEGHMIFITHWDEIVAALVAAIRSG
jgi:pimeloyl-ACP methyl ester carboxylesterase